MKTKIAAAALLLAAIVAFGQSVFQYGQFIKTVTAADPPEGITSTNLLVHSVTLKGIKGARTANVGTVYIGFTTNNDEQAFALTSGGEVVIQARTESGRINLKNIYIDVLNAGDGVGVFFE